ncbi:MAG: hypothetical protein HGB19_03305 [Chlorobiales bacterium]|nr:hypothetical protein [Chlorobiales bacterium]
MIQPLPFSPRGAVTGVGSLPMTDPQEAIQFVETCCPEVPFWPQLPRRSASESMVEQVLGPLKPFLKPAEGVSRFGYDVRDGALSEFIQALGAAPVGLDDDRAAGFFAFEHALQNGSFRKALALKGQLIGPITLSGLLFLNGRSFLHEPALAGKVGAYLERVAHWQIDRLKVFGRPVLMFFDEPGFGCLAKKELLVNELLRVLSAGLQSVRRRGAFCGLHCCASGPYKLMCEAGPDVISFDADQDLDAFFNEPSATEFVRQGGSVAFGLVPTCLTDRSFDTEKVFARWKTALEKCVNFPDVAKQSFITASCGLGLRPQDEAELTFKFAGALHDIVRKRLEM